MQKSGYAGEQLSATGRAVGVGSGVGSGVGWRGVGVGATGVAVGCDRVGVGFGVTVGVAVGVAVTPLVAVAVGVCVGIAVGVARSSGMIDSTGSGGARRNGREAAGRSPHATRASPKSKSTANASLRCTSEVYA